MKALLIEDYLKQFFQIYKNNDKSSYYNYIVLKGDDLYSVKIEPEISMQWKYEGKIDKSKYSINGTLVRKPSKQMIYILQNVLKPTRMIEAAYTKSYNMPVTKEDVTLLITKILKKRQADVRPINSMTHWLKLNNLGDYQHNKWLRATIDTLFINSGGTWVRKNTQYSIEQLTDMVMNYWNKKLSAA